MSHQLIKLCLSASVLVTFSALADAQKSLGKLIDRDIAALVVTYKTLHAAPELSHYEEKTSAFVAKECARLAIP